MKFVKEVTPKGVSIPHTALCVSGLDKSGLLEMHTLQKTVVLLQEHMTASELLDAVQSLRTLAFSLLDHLVEVCGSCESYERSCAKCDSDTAGIILPQILREAADIPENAKLRICIDRDERSITLTMMNCPDMLQIIPPELLEELYDEDICIAALEEHLAQEDIIYGV